MRRQLYRPLPSSLPSAFEADKNHAIRKGYSVERLADLEGCSASALYKRIEDAQWPVRRLARWFELTGGKAVISYLCAQAGGMFIPIPSGRRVSPIEASELQQLLADTSLALLRFYNEKIDAAETVTTIQRALEGLAYHRENVRKSAQPELELSL